MKGAFRPGSTPRGRRRKNRPESRDVKAYCPASEGPAATEPTATGLAGLPRTQKRTKKDTVVDLKR